jgi:hypothetical protein
VSLVIKYKDGSNPFVVIGVEREIIGEHVKWQLEHNGDIIEKIIITDDDGNDISKEVYEGWTPPDFIDNLSGEIDILGV